MRGDIKVLSCKSGADFASKVCDKLSIFSDKPKDQIFVSSEEVYFPNGEYKTKIGSLIRGSDIYVVQNLYDPNIQIENIDCVDQSGYFTGINPNYVRSINDNHIKSEGGYSYYKELVYD